MQCILYFNLYHSISIYLNICISTISIFNLRNTKHLKMMHFMFKPIKVYYSYCNYQLYTLQLNTTTQYSVVDGTIPFVNVNTLCTNSNTKSNNNTIAIHSMLNLKRSCRVFNRPHPVWSIHHGITKEYRLSLHSEVNSTGNNLQSFIN